MDISTTLPPQNLDAERSILGACFIDYDTIERVTPILSSPDDFYKEAHKVVWLCMLELKAKREPLDYITISNLLRDRGNLEMVGGGAFLTELVDSCPTSANCEYYARIVRDKAMRRSVIKTSYDLMRASYEGDDVSPQITSSITRLIDAQIGVSENRSKAIGEWVTDVNRELAVGPLDLRKGTVGSGFKELDKLIKFRPKMLAYIGGRPGSGKTTAALQMCLNIARSEGPTAYFSNELSGTDATTRIICAESGVPARTLYTGPGEALERKMEDVFRGETNFASSPMYFSDEMLSINDIRTECQRIMNFQKQPLKAVFIDRIELLKDVIFSRKSNYNETIQESSSKLKFLAREFDIPVIVLMQLKRLGDRKDMRPTLEDFRGSGAPEQDAQIAIAVYRNSYYTNDEEDLQAELIVLKNTQGPLGTALVKWEGKYPAFSN